MNSSLLRRRAWPLAALSGILATFALAVAQQAKPVLAPPLLNLNPITVANGTAIVAGTVGGTPDTNLQLTANGQPLGVDAAGHFAGVVNLNGGSALDFGVVSPSLGGNVAFHVPLNGLGPLGGVIPGNVLSALEAAGVSLVKPLDGFKIVDGLPLTVGGQVADKGQLAKLTVNGMDVLPTLKPDQSFSLQLPGTTKEVQVTSTDKQSNTETRTYEVVHTSSLLATPLGTSVAASSANGLRIASVRYYANGVQRTKQLRMVITLKDRQGRLVRGASVNIRAAQAGRVIGRAKAKRSSLTGQASFIVRIRPRALGTRLAMVTTAKTPSATAQKTTSLRLPRSLRKAHRFAKRKAHR